MSDDITFVIRAKDDATKPVGEIITSFERLGKSGDSASRRVENAIDKDLGKALVKTGVGVGKLSKLVGSATSGLDNMGAVGLASTKGIGQGLLVVTSILPTLIDQVNDLGPALKGAVGGLSGKLGEIESGGRVGSGFVKGLKGVAVLGIAAMGAELIAPLNRAGDDIIHHLFGLQTADEKFISAQFQGTATRALKDAIAAMPATAFGEELGKKLSSGIEVGLGALLKFVKGPKFLGGDAIVTHTLPVMRHSGMVLGKAVDESVARGVKGSAALVYAATTNMGTYGVLGAKIAFGKVGRVTGDAIRSGMDAVRSAAKQLVWEFQHPLNLAKKKTELLGILHGKLLAKGLASKDPDTRAAAEKLKAGVEAELALIAARQAGDKAGRDYQTALLARVAATEAAVRAAVIRINAALNAGTSNNANRGSGHLASGGPAPAFSVNTVGENGPETLIQGAVGGYVVPYARGGGGSSGGAAPVVNINIHSTFPPTARQSADIARQIGPELARWFRGQGLSPTW